MTERRAKLISDEQYELLRAEYFFEPVDILTMPPLSDIIKPGVKVEGPFGVFVPTDVDNPQDEQRVSETNKLLLGIIDQMPDKIDMKTEHQTAVIGHKLFELPGGGNPHCLLYTSPSPRDGLLY